MHWPSILSSQVKAKGLQAAQVKMAATAAEADRFWSATEKVKTWHQLLGGRDSRAGDSQTDVMPMKSMTNQMATFIHMA